MTIKRTSDELLWQLLAQLPLGEWLMTHDRTNVIQVREVLALMAVEAKTVAAIIDEVTARRDRAEKHRHAPYGDGCDECGREKALDDMLDWLSDWKRGGHG